MHNQCEQQLIEAAVLRGFSGQQRRGLRIRWASQDSAKSIDKT